MPKTFTIVYVPLTHDGKKNTDNKPETYQIFQPEAGFGNTRDGDDFAGFKAQRTDGQGYRSFRWDRVRALVPNS